MQYFDDLKNAFYMVDAENSEITFSEIIKPTSLSGTFQNAKIKKINGLDEMVIDPNVDTWNAFKGLQIGQDLEIGKWQLSERQIYTYIHECIMATYNHNLTDPSIAEPQQGPQKWKDLPNDIRM